MITDYLLSYWNALTWLGVECFNLRQLVFEIFKIELKSSPYFSTYSDMFTYVGTEMTQIGDKSIKL